MEKWKLPELKERAEKLKLEVEGTGANGRAVRNDYLQALLKYERDHPKRGPKQTSPKRSPRREESTKVWTIEKLDIAPVVPMITSTKYISSGPERRWRRNSNK